MRRREFIAVVAGGVAGWPLVAQAQLLEQIRKIGMLVNFPSEDPEGQARNIIGRRVTTVGCQEWLPSSCAVRWR